MSQLLEDNQENFKWGTAVDTVPNDLENIRFRSFTYQGVEYTLHDCVYLYHEGGKETDIGKLVKIWKTKKGGKRGKVLWFFRPRDVYHHLRDYKPSWNELFLASGQGKGVSNVIPLEAIIAKCYVVCTAKDLRNTLPSKSDLRMADYFFSHTFDVGDLKISDKFPNTIEMIKVDRLFKWNRDKIKANEECKVSGAFLKDSILNDEQPINVGVPSTCENFQIHTLEAQSVKKRKIIEAADSILRNEQPDVGIPSTCEDSEIHTSEAHAIKKREIIAVADSLTPRQDNRRWFTNLPWEERLKEAHESGAIIHLVNLDPLYTSSDVQDIIASAFKLKVDAKIIKRGHYCNPLYGEALVIFHSKDDADKVIRELHQKCLVVGERRHMEKCNRTNDTILHIILVVEAIRPKDLDIATIRAGPLIARKFSLDDRIKNCNFPGHLIMDWVKFQTNKRKALFTAHCTQANTIEHEMATQWRVLQQKVHLWWEALREEQAHEIYNYISQLSKSPLTAASEEATPALESPVNAMHEPASV